MLDNTAETRVEYLERSIAEVRDQRDLLQNKPLGVSNIGPVSTSPKKHRANSGSDLTGQQIVTKVGVTQ